MREKGDVREGKRAVREGKGVREEGCVREGKGG